MTTAAKTKARLRTLAPKQPVTQYLSPRDYLRAVYVAIKAEAEAYSYLQFAVDLGFPRCNVIRLIIIGERPLTSKTGDRIAKALELHGSDRRYWTTLVKYGNARLPAERDGLFRLLMSYKTQSQPTELDPLQAEYFSEWYHPVIREMTALTDFNGDPQWIKARLNFPLRLEQIKRSMDILVDLKVITLDPTTGRYHRSTELIVTEAEIDSMAIVRYHQKMIEVGREAITTVPESQRDVRAVTVTLSQAALPILKGKIEELVLQVAAMEELQKSGDLVVQVNVQMFPFTKV